jgi:hypothetical protein
VRSSVSEDVASQEWVFGVRVSDVDGLPEVVTVALVVGVCVGWSELVELRPSCEYEIETESDSEPTLVAVAHDEL